MINRSFFLLISFLLASPVQAKEIHIPHFQFTSNTHTHTPIELKPASFDKSYKVASVCFLGIGDCPQGGFNKGDEDYSIDSAKQCLNEGYVKNNCSAVQEPAEYCPYSKAYIKGCKCKSSLVTCTSPKLGVGTSCGGKYASCTCPSTVLLTNPNDRCTQYCDGNCIAKTCSPNASESGCSYGTQSCSNGCGGTRNCCKPCSPYSDETGCSYGTYSCSNGCGGTRKCCASCSPYSNETGCSYGTYNCSDGCGGTRKCCASCSPYSNEIGCQYGTYTCSNGCGGNRTCCSAKPACTPKSNETGCSYGTENCSDGCNGTRTCCKPNPWKYMRYVSTSETFCNKQDGKYWAMCKAKTYCVNGATENYICELGYAYGKSFTPQGWGGAGFDTLAECEAAGTGSCSKLLGDGSLGECDNGTTKCHY